MLLKKKVTLHFSLCIQEFLKFVRQNIYFFNGKSMFVSITYFNMNESWFYWRILK